MGHRESNDSRLLTLELTLAEVKKDVEKLTGSVGEMSTALRKVETASEIAAEVRSALEEQSQVSFTRNQKVGGLVIAAAMVMLQATTTLLTNH